MRIISIDPSLRSTGIFYVEDGAVNSEVIQKKGDRLEVLGYMARKFALESKGFDLLIIEDYSFGAGGSRSITVQAELGGLIRGLFSARGVPILEMPIQLWKAVTDIRGKKGTAMEKSDYLNLVGEKFKVRFKTTDESDAFLMYQTVRLCCLRSEFLKYPSAQKVRDRIQDLKINPEKL